VANAGTSGFRAERTLFEAAFRQAGEPRELAFVQDVGTVRDQRPGPITPTGNPLDLALDGEGWLTFQATGGTAYGRAGHLEINGQGEIVDAAGNRLLDDAGTPIALPPNDREVSVAADGTISNRAGQVARIGLAAFSDPQVLTPRGDGLMRADVPPQPAAARVVQGAVEGSNVEPVLEMTRLIETSRAFEGTQRLVDIHHELERRMLERTLGSA
jgi:flagellar basal-body rod protein FlgF